MTSASFMINRSSPLNLISVPDHLPNKMRSRDFHVRRFEVAAFVAGTRANGNDFAFSWLFLGGVWNDNPALGSASIRRTTTRLCNGRKTGVNIFGILRRERNPVAAPDGVS